MHKHRVLIFVISIVGVIGIAWLLIQLGNGYRPNIQNKSVDITGLLVTNSDPKGAQVYINGQVKTATDDTLNLEPGTYNVELKKNGFFPWSKTLKVEPSLVTQTNALLFPSTTDLKAITYTGVINPNIAPNNSRLVYAVSHEATTSASSDPESGIWMLELSDLPLRFNRDPKQLVTGLPEKINPSEIEFKWSYDSQEVLILVPTGTSNPSNQTTRNSKPTPTPTSAPRQFRAYRFPLNNELTTFNNEFLVENYEKLLEDWKLKSNIRVNSQLSELPIKLKNTLASASSELIFSPDETKIMYVATANDK